MTMTLNQFLELGNIIHFDKFDFKDGLKKKGRLGIILKNDGTHVTIATTSATFSVPNNTLTLHNTEKGDKGCVTHVEESIKCYRFIKGKVIGMQNKYAFTDECYINLHIRPMIFIRSIQEIDNEYFKKNSLGFRDKLSLEEFYELIYCIHHSKYIPKGLKQYTESECERLNALIGK